VDEEAPERTMVMQLPTAPEAGEDDWTALVDELDK
jgi:hypothetical protein